MFDDSPKGIRIVVRDNTINLIDVFYNFTIHVDAFLKENLTLKLGTQVGVRVASPYMGLWLVGGL